MSCTLKSSSETYPMCLLCPSCVTSEVLSAILNVLVQCQTNIPANMRGDNCHKFFRPWNTETDTSATESPSSISTETAIETDCSPYKSGEDNERFPSPVINEDPSIGNLDRLSNFVMNTTSKPTFQSWSSSSKNSENYDHLKRSNTDSSSSESGASHGSTSPPSAFATLPTSIPVGHWATMTNNPTITFDMIVSSYRELCRRFISTSISSDYSPNMKKAMELLEEQDAAKRMKKLRPKKFRCEYCKVAFSNNGQLKGHIRIHTGERPFKCDVEKCGKSFTRNEELTRHKRIHTGDRPHVCHFCPKRFGRKDHLKKHMKTHFLRSGSSGFDESTSAFSIFGRQSGSLLPVMPPSTFAPTTIIPLTSSMIPSPTFMPSSLQSPLLPPPLFPPPPPPMIPSLSFRPRTISVASVPQPYFASLPITPSTSIGSTSTPLNTTIMVPAPQSSFSELPEIMLPSEFSSLPNPDLSSLPESPSLNPSISPSSSIESTIGYRLHYLNRYGN